MAFRRHFSRVGSAERCTETIFTDHQRQVCDYALVYAEKKNDGEAPYSVSFTATQSGPCRRAASRGAGVQDVRRRSRIAAAGCHRGWPARRACGPGRRRARAAAAQRRRSARLLLHCP